MPLIRYEDWKPTAASKALVDQVNGIIAEYQAEGYSLTLRQVYYQLVSRDIIPNKVQAYKNLGDLVSKGRRAGLIDWNAIVDRTRMLRSLSTWDDPESIVQAVAQQFRFDWWANQDNYVEVWFEKDALLGVFERAANTMRVPYFSCRGYPSDSEVWGAARRLRGVSQQDKYILHFGDHDPSGMDMTRDIEDRLRLFGARGVTVERLALNMDQIEQYDPPPNPAKESDSRFVNYQAQYGDESWELDALEPRVLNRIVRDRVGELIDEEQWEEDTQRELAARQQLQAVSNKWAKVTESQVVKKEAARLAGEGFGALPDEDEDPEEDPNEEE